MQDSEPAHLLVEIKLRYDDTSERPPRDIEGSVKVDSKVSVAR